MLRSARKSQAGFGRHLRGVSRGTGERVLGRSEETPQGTSSRLNLFSQISARDHFLDSLRLIPQKPLAFDMGSLPFAYHINSSGGRHPNPRDFRDLWRTGRGLCALQSLCLRLANPHTIESRKFPPSLLREGFRLICH